MARGPIGARLGRVRGGAGLVGRAVTLEHRPRAIRRLVRMSQSTTDSVALLSSRVEKNPTRRDPPVLSQSPYAPPRANLEPEVEGHRAGTGTFEIGVCTSEAFAAMRDNFPLWFGVGIVWLLATVASAITIVGIFLLVPVIGWGATAFGLRMYDRTARFGDLWSGFSRYGHALGAMLVYLGASMLAGIPSQILGVLAAASENTLLQVAAMLVHWVVLLWVSARMAFAPLFMVDQELTGGAALRESWQHTRAVQWKLIGLMFVMGAVFLAGVLVVGVGVIQAAVVAYLMNVSAYRQVVGGPVRA
jgi:hypothetical protein